MMSNTTPYTDCYFTNSSGLQQYYRDYGKPSDSAEVMLCMPGLTRNSRDFEEVAQQFAPYFHVIAVEQRGRGKSAYDPDPSRYIPTTYVADMFVLLKHLGVEKIHACGTSLGGLMTLLMQAANPGCIKTAIMNDIGPEIDPAGIERIRNYVGGTTKHNDWASAITSTKAMAGDVFPAMNDADWDNFTRKIYVERDGQIVLDYDMALADAFKGATPDQAAPDLWPIFDFMKTIPLMVIRGMTSDLFSQKTMDRMADTHPDMAGVLVPNVGHCPLLTEEPVVTAFDAWARRFGIQK